jgi:hypothetical protein
MGADGCVRFLRKCKKSGPAREQFRKHSVKWRHGACATGMLDREEQLRQSAAECLVLAKRAANLKVRTGLIIMAQKLYELADSEPSRWAPLDSTATTI